MCVCVHMKGYLFTMYISSTRYFTVGNVDVGLFQRVFALRESRCLTASHLPSYFLGIIHRHARPFTLLEHTHIYNRISRAPVVCAPRLSPKIYTLHTPEPIARDVSFVNSSANLWPILKGNTKSLFGRGDANRGKKYTEEKFKNAKRYNKESSVGNEFLLHQPIVWSIKKFVYP